MTSITGTLWRSRVQAPAGGDLSQADVQGSHSDPAGQDLHPESGKAPGLLNSCG